MKFLEIFKKAFKRKEKWIPMPPYVEEDTKCDKCEYLQECIDNGNVVDCRTFYDLRSHYIKGCGSFAKCDGVDISREAVNKYALEHFGRVPETMSEREYAMEAKVIDELERMYKDNLRVDLKSAVMRKEL